MALGHHQGPREGRPVFPAQPMNDLDRILNFRISGDKDDDGIAQLGLVQGGEFFAAQTCVRDGKDFSEKIWVLGERLREGEDLDGIVGDVTAEEGIVDEDNPRGGFCQLNCGARADRRISSWRLEGLKIEELQVGKTPCFIFAGRHRQVGKRFPCAALGLGEPRRQAGVIPRRGVKEYRSHKGSWG